MPRPSRPSSAPLHKHHSVLRAPTATENVFSRNIPGYTGHIPQAQYVIGETFGTTTRQLEDEHGFDVSLMARRDENDGTMTASQIRQQQQQQRSSEALSLDACSFSRKPPYHTPSYTGHIPQQQYVVGETFGKSTHDLLTEKDPVTRPNAHLSTTSLPEPSTRRERIVRNRQRFPTPYSTNQVPGYTGFIPHAHDITGQTYAEQSKTALAEHELDFQRREDERLQVREQVTASRMELATRLAANHGPKKDSKTHSRPTPSDSDCASQGGDGGDDGDDEAGNSVGQDTHPHRQSQRRKPCSRRTTELPREQVFTPRVVYSRQAGIPPHYTGHIPHMSTNDPGKTFGVASRESAVLLREKHVPLTTPRGQRLSLGLTKTFAGDLRSARHHPPLGTRGRPGSAPVYRPKPKSEWIV
eukprot:m.20130 g.20130  ORF g.20130 m.20130 type:complete len:413 (-) comp6092_c0_seq1:111-1349(-)